MGFLNVYNNFKDFNAHLSHAFKVTFFNNIQTNDENAASFSVKSVTKPVFKLSTEEYTRELGNSRFVIPIIDFSSAHMSITFYESDNMAVQAYLSSIYGLIGTVPPPIKILLEEYDNSMCIRLSSKVYLARLIELSLPGFNNDGPGSIQEITAEFNVMRVYDNLPDISAPVDLKYGYNGGYKFKHNDTEINVETSSLKPSAIKIDNITPTQYKWKSLQITKKTLVSEYKTKMSELNDIFKKQEECISDIESVDVKIEAANLSNTDKARVKSILTTIYENEEDGSVWAYDTFGAGSWRKFDDLDALYNFITTKTWHPELLRNEGLGINTITDKEFATYVYLSSLERDIKPLKTDLRKIAARLTGMQGTIEELKTDQEVIEFVAEHPEYKDEGLSLDPIPGDEDGGQGGSGQGGSGQGGAAPAPAGGRQGGQSGGRAPAPAGGRQGGNGQGGNGQGGNGQGGNGQGAAPAPAAPAAPAPAGWKSSDFTFNTLRGKVNYQDTTGSISGATVRKFYATETRGATAPGKGNGTKPTVSHEPIKHLEIHRTASIKAFGTSGYAMGETIASGFGVGGYINRNGSISYNLDRAFTKHSGAGGLGSTMGATFAIEMEGAVNIVQDINGKYYQRISGLGGNDIIYKEMTAQEVSAYTLIKHDSTNSSANMLANARKNTGDKKVKMINGDIKTVKIAEDGVYAQAYSAAELKAMKEYGYQFAKDGVKVDIANLKISAHGDRDSAKARGKTEGIKPELNKLLEAFKEGYRLGQGQGH